MGCQDRYSEEGSPGHDFIAWRVRGQAVGGRYPPPAGWQISLRLRAHHQHACGISRRSQDGIADIDRFLSDRKAAARLQHRSDRPLSAICRPIVQQHDELRDRQGDRQAYQAQGISHGQEPELGRDRQLLAVKRFPAKWITGSREENASKQEIEPRSDSIGTEKALVLLSQKVAVSGLRESVKVHISERAEHGSTTVS